MNLAGQEFGVYRIVAALGSGGMGEVYLAEDTRLHRKVAIMVLPPSIAEDEIARKRLPGHLFPRCRPTAVRWRPRGRSFPPSR